ncbi:MAG: LysR family transcriptional regulator [Syntrophobacterales bacterium]|nr:LysR family transcriptional regulator [Syntrophobacterales bacterium]MDI9570137.1 LysR family transcriptional regulator [Pseudomonadota bacterium]
MDTHLNLLKVFHVTAREGSFTRAAAALFITQPGISKHIRDLEEHYGTRLFDRLGKRVVLTQAGKIVFAKTEAIFTMIEQMKAEIDDLEILRGGALKIGASMTIGVYVLPTVLRKFRDTYPLVEIDLDVSLNRHVEENLLRNSVDLGFLGAPTADPRLMSGPFMTDELVVIVPAGHAWACRDAVSPHDLLNETYVVSREGSGTRRIAAARLAEKGIVLTRTMEFGHTEAVKKAVEAGLGIGILSRLAVAREERLGLIKSLPLEQVELTREFFFAYRKDKYLNRAAKAFLEYALYGQASPNV